MAQLNVNNQVSPVPTHPDRGRLIPTSAVISLPFCKVWSDAAREASAAARQMKHANVPENRAISWQFDGKHWTNAEPLVLYHGTTEDRSANIDKEGLRYGNLTADPAYAREIANIRREDQSPVVYKVSAPRGSVFPVFHGPKGIATDALSIAKPITTVERLTKTWSDAAREAAAAARRKNKVVVEPEQVAPSKSNYVWFDRTPFWQNKAVQYQGKTYTSNDLSDIREAMNGLPTLMHDDLAFAVAAKHGVEAGDIKKGFVGWDNQFHDRNELESKVEQYVSAYGFPDHAVNLSQQRHVSKFAQFLRSLPNNSILVELHAMGKCMECFYAENEFNFAVCAKCGLEPLLKISSDTEARDEHGRWVYRFQDNPADDRARAALTQLASSAVVGGDLAHLHPGDITVYRAGNVGHKGTSFSKDLAQAKRQLFVSQSKITALQLKPSDPALDFNKILPDSRYAHEQEVFVDTRNLDRSRLSTVSSFEKAWTPEAREAAADARRARALIKEHFADKPEFQMVSYPVVKPGDAVDGLVVRAEIPNTDSISGVSDDVQEWSGIRAVPMAFFTKSAGYASSDDSKRASDLANQIKASGEINPLIVVLDTKGPYILEGSHRFDALQKLGKTSFPALCVTDQQDFTNFLHHKTGALHKTFIDTEARDERGRWTSSGVSLPESFKQRILDSKNPWNLLTKSQWEPLLLAAGHSQADIDAADKLLQAHGISDSTHRADKEIEANIESGTGIGRVLQDSAELEKQAYQLWRSGGQARADKQIAEFKKEWEDFGNHDAYESPEREIDVEHFEWLDPEKWERVNVYRGGDPVTGVESWTTDPRGANTGGAGRIKPDRKSSVEAKLAAGGMILGGINRMMGAPGESEITFYTSPKLKKTFSDSEARDEHGRWVSEPIGYRSVATMAVASPSEIKQVLALADAKEWKYRDPDELPLREIPADKLVSLQDVENSKAVEGYQGRVKAGEDLSSKRLAYLMSGKYYLLNGTHRASAEIAEGRNRIAVHVLEDSSPGAFDKLTKTFSDTEARDNHGKWISGGQSKASPAFKAAVNRGWSQLPSNVQDVLAKAGVKLLALRDQADAKAFGLPTEDYLSGETFRPEEGAQPNTCVVYEYMHATITDAAGNKKSVNLLTTNPDEVARHELMHALDVHTNDMATAVGSYKAVAKIMIGNEAPLAAKSPATARLGYFLTDQSNTDTTSREESFAQLAAEATAPKGYVSKFGLTAVLPESAKAVRAFLKQVGTDKLSKAWSDAARLAAEEARRANQQSALMAKHDEVKDHPARGDLNIVRPEQWRDYTNKLIALYRQTKDVCDKACAINVNKTVVPERRADEQKVLLYLKQVRSTLSSLPSDATSTGAVAANDALGRLHSVIDHLDKAHGSWDGSKVVYKEKMGVRPFWHEPHN